MLHIARKPSAVTPSGRQAILPVAGQARSPVLHHLHASVGNRAVQRLLRSDLKLSERSDAAEVHADHTANEVMRMPGSDGAPLTPPATGASRVQELVSDSGHALDDSARGFMEPRFGRNFGGVRVHTDAEAAESARQLRARAYTHGDHIVFGAGEYAPGTDAGRRLLAHELAHVVQQDGGVIHRAEVDDRSCAGLTDIESDVNSHVNAQITAARATVGMPLSLAALRSEVRDLLGNGIISPIERFIEGLPATKRIIPPSSLAGTKYAGIGVLVNPAYSMQSVTHVLGSAAKVKGICIGADKLGHFFNEGYSYYRVRNEPALGGTLAAAQSTGRGLEIGIQGLSTTGVYSNADRAANEKGLQFYTDLTANPSMTFAIANYIASDWNEQSNPSFYESGVGSVIWSNLLTGAWTGTFTTGGGTSSPITINANLAATSAGALTGTYSWPATSPTTTGAITGGTITQRTTAVSGQIPGDPAVSATPVSGVRIDYDWTSGSNSGKGTFLSANEQTLNGTWGNGASRTNGGTWNLRKV